MHSRQVPNVPILAIFSERFKEVSNHSSHVILKRGAVEPRLNHTFFFFFASTSPTSIKEVGREVAQSGIQGRLANAWAAVPWTLGELGGKKTHPLTRIAAAEKSKTATPPSSPGTAPSLKARAERGHALRTSPFSVHCPQPEHPDVQRP